MKRQPFWLHCIRFYDSVGNFFARIPRWLSCEIIAAAVDNNIFAQNVADSYPLGQKSCPCLGFFNKERRKISAVPRVRVVIFVEMFARFRVMNMHAENVSAADFLWNSSHGNHSKDPCMRIKKHQCSADCGVIHRSANLRNRRRAGSGKEIQNPP